MNIQTEPKSYITDIRELARRFDARAIEQCIQLALAEQANPCYTTNEASETMNVLAKTGFVIGQMQQGMTLAQAIRELGRRIRAVQGA